jgi:hypothetical protein
MTSNMPDPPQVPPDIPAGEGDKVACFVLNGTRTSDGSGPGVKRLDPAEAGRLIAMKMAVAGDRPPRGWTLEA